MRRAREEYLAKLRDPRWQKKRLTILERDNWECRRCHDTEATLHVHHRHYANSDPWDVPDFWLETLCEDCHEEETGLRRTVEQNLLARMRVMGFTVADIDILHGYLDGIDESDIPTFIRLLLDLDKENQTKRTGCYRAIAGGQA